MSKPGEWVLEVEQLSRSFVQGPRRIDVLKSVGLRVRAGESLAIVGASGAGKSTLLHILGGLDQPDAGQVRVNGQSLWSLTERDRCIFRNRHMGFVYQFHHLLPEFSALENVAMPLLIRGLKPSVAAEKARSLLNRVGLEDRLTHKPGELSGGERQRAAVARALVTEPSLILGDEPTGNLDENTAESVYQMMLGLNQEFGTSLILVTHDSGLAARMDHRLELRQGQLHKLP